MADQAFLDTLKPGDRVVLRTRRLDTWGRHSGPEVYTITKITPKRTRFDLVDKDGRTIEVKGHGDYVVGSGWDRHHYSMQPYTPETDKEIARDDARLKAKSRAFRMHEALLNFERQVLDLKPEEVEHFLAASKTLAVFLEAFKEKKP